jgi:hypothetical protein
MYAVRWPRGFNSNESSLYFLRLANREFLVRWVKRYKNRLILNCALVT